MSGRTQDDRPTAVERAQADADAARARLQATVSEIGHRLRPSTLVHDAADSAKETALKVAGTATDTARKVAGTAGDMALERPVAAGTGAAVVTGLLGWGLWRRRSKGATSSNTGRSHPTISTNDVEGRAHGGYQDSEREFLEVERERDAVE